MNTKVEVQRRRHIIKAISWRLVGTLDTWIISWLLLTHIGDFTFFDININPNTKKTVSYTHLTLPTNREV